MLVLLVLVFVIDPCLCIIIIIIIATTGQPGTDIIIFRRGANFHDGIIH